MSDVVYDFAEPIEAYRCWRLTPWANRVDSVHPKVSLRLAALSFSTVWDREMTAVPCVRSSPEYHAGVISSGLVKCDGPPCAGKGNPNNKGTLAYGCGLYALKTLSGALFEMGFNPDLVVGKVLLGGKVWPHESGYRAEKAQIVGLYSADSFSRYQKYLEFRPIWLGSDAELSSVALDYGVPIFAHPSEEEERTLIADLEEFWVGTRLGMPI